MRLRTFNAPDMKLAMRMIRETLGDDAIIISSSRASSGNGIVVTAATEPAADMNVTRASPPMPPVTTLLHAAALTPEPVLERIEEILQFHSTPADVTTRLIEMARHLCLQGRDERIDMTRLMAASFQYAPLPLDQESYAIMLVGPPGTGKTMTIAKMASQVVMEKKKPVVITTDNKRAGGVEQLSAFTTILGIELHVADNRGELWRMLKEYVTHNNRVFIDTGGVNPYNVADLRELAEYIKLDRNLEPVLVSAAGSDSGEADDMVRAFAPLGVRRLLVTRIDAARRYGSAITAAHNGKLAFSHASNSSRIIGEFVTFDPATLTELLLRHTNVKN